MATGDNMLTALSVGRKCGIIKPEEIVYLGDLVEDSEDPYINWKISKEADEIPENQVEGAEIDETWIENPVLPWEGKEESSFAIAVTGKVFNYLLKNPTHKAILY